MKILTVVGARPQFIKAATVSRVIRDKEGISEVLVHTGQHYDTNMSDVFFDELDIPRPDHHLAIGGGNHGAMTGRQLEAIEKVLLDEKPDWVLVYGDTNSTLAGALAASKIHIPVAHVEAGLRSFNRSMPEELNRIVTDHLSNRLFPPTDSAVAHLANEGIVGSNVFQVGDVMYDAAKFYRDQALQPTWFGETGLLLDNFVLATIHRAENTDNPDHLKGILAGLEAGEKAVLMPLHPRTRDRLKEFGLTLPANVHAVDPVSYLEMVWLEKNCALIATDSGGVQKEAYFHGRNCVVLRNETEWVELVNAGWNEVVGTNAKAIASSILGGFEKATLAPLYGDGNAANLIVDSLQ